MRCHLFCHASKCRGFPVVGSLLQDSTRAEQQSPSPAPQHMRTGKTTSSAWPRRPACSTGTTRAAQLPPLEGPPTLAAQMPAQVQLPLPRAQHRGAASMHSCLARAAGFRIMPKRLCSTWSLCLLRQIDSRSHFRGCLRKCVTSHCLCALVPVPIQTTLSMWLACACSTKDSGIPRPSKRVLIVHMLPCPGLSYSEALGSARGAHSLGPSESDSDMGDLHPQAMEEASRRAPQKLHTGHTGPDTFHEAASSR